MEKSKKNGFCRFMCSLLPGAGEMYMGFMKMGVSIMILFFIMCGLADLLGSGLFVMLAVVIWCYSFFRVHNLASMPDERFRVYHDDYIFSDSSKYGDVFSTGNKFYKIEAAVLIFLGTLMCIKGVYRSVVNYIPAEYQGVINQVVDMLPRLIVGILIIALGIWMIRGKKKELDNSDNYDVSDSTNNAPSDGRQA